MAWPTWWDWEIELSSHVEDRMEDRAFTEVDLRAMIHRARAVVPSIVRGRFVLDTTHRRRRWAVIVEPDRARRRMVVVTAFAKEC
jgi:hypothetical protein